jgi:hypothetical protein
MDLRRPSVETMALLAGRAIFGGYFLYIGGEKSFRSMLLPRVMPHRFRMSTNSYRGSDLPECNAGMSTLHAAC